MIYLYLAYQHQSLDPGIGSRIPGEIRFKPLLCVCNLFKTWQSNLFMIGFG